MIDWYTPMCSVRHHRFGLLTMRVRYSPSFCHTLKIADSVLYTIIFSIRDHFCLCFAWILFLFCNFVFFFTIWFLLSFWMSIFSLFEYYYYFFFICFLKNLRYQKIFVKTIEIRMCVIFRCHLIAVSAKSVGIFYYCWIFKWKHLIGSAKHAFCHQQRAALIAQLLEKFSGDK